MPYNTPYYSSAQSRRQRRQMWNASANDPSMPVGWSDFVNNGKGSDSFLQDVDASGAISGGLALAGTYTNMVNQELGLEAPPTLERSATGEPVYTAGQTYNQASLSQPKGASGGEILSAAGQGAAAGTTIMPGIGTAVGAVVGAGISIFGGSRRKKKQKREKQKALNQVANRQQEFNTASESFAEQQLATDDYYRRLNIDDQLYNLYR